MKTDMLTTDTVTTKYHQSRQWFMQYGLALMATGLAAFARWLLPGALTPAPYLGFYPAVVVSAALGGLGPGLFATFASLLLVNFVFGRFNIADHGSMMRQVIWIVASIGVSLLAEMQRRTRKRAEDEAGSARAAEQALRRQVELVDPVRAEVIAREMQRAVRDRWDEDALPGKTRDDLFRRIPDAAGGLVAGLGLLVLAGWVFDLYSLKTLVPGLPTMKANTAICFVFSGLALTLRKQHLTSSGLTFAVLAIAGLSMAEYVSGLNLHIDQLLFSDTADRYTIYPGRMVEATALGFMMTAASLLILGEGSPMRDKAQQVLALGAGAIGVIALLGYAYNADALYRFTGYSSMALHTALSLVFLAIGLVFANRDGLVGILSSPDPVAQMLRRLLPVVLLAPSIIGWLVGRGVKIGIFVEGMDLAILALLMTLSLTALVWWTGVIVRRTDAARRETETQLRNQADLMNQSQDALIICEEGGVIRYWNRGAEEIYGWPKHEALGRNKQLFIRIDEHVLKELDRQLENIGHWEGKLVSKTVDGRLIVVESRQTASRGADGRLIVLESNRDITKREQAEAALRASEERFRIMFEGHGAAMLLIEPGSGKIIDANEAASRLYGYSREQFREMRIDQINQLTPEEIAGERQAAVDQTRNVFVFPHLLASGEVRFMEVYSSPVTVQGKPILFSIVHDITERKRVQEALVESEQRYRSIVETAEEGIATHAPDGTITYVNQRMADMLGYSRAEIIGNSSLDFVDDVEKEKVIKAREIVKEQGNFSEERKLRRKDGSTLWTLCNISPRRDIAGNFLGFLAMHTDINERKKVHEELEERVEERTTELTATVTRLELLNRELEEFAFIASHDLQEPLRKIETFSDRISQSCASIMDEKGKDYLEKVQRSASRMRSLLTDLLKYSRVARKAEPYKQINLEKVAKEAAEIFDLKIKDKGATVEIGALPALEADESQMFQLFQNLIGNALKFSNENNPLIQIKGRAIDQKTCEIFVKDNGIGFESSYAQRIFKPFERLHGRDAYEGTGMGLAICRKIVERHGGTIRAESEPGKGATFFIQLPLKQKGSELY